MPESRGSVIWTKYKDSSQMYATLNNGLKMPLLGLGTSGGKAQECTEAVQQALKIGYKHIDTAASYGNEEAVGKGIKCVKREDVFITTKLANPDHGRVEAAVKGSLQKLQTDYIDLYLMHWPITKHVKNGEVDPSIKETWQAMEEMYDKGLVKAIGVSNFTVKKLKDLQSYARIQPAVNQVEVHAWHRNSLTVDYCLNQGIQIQAYGPMGGTWTYDKSPSSDSTIIEIAQAYSKTPNQILLRWNLQHGSCVIPKSTNAGRIQENAEIWDWELKEGDFKKISEISFQVRMCDGVKQGFIDDSPYATPEEFWDGE